MITQKKEKYKTPLNEKLDEIETEPKAYWDIINKFLNNKIVHNILLLLVNG